MSRSAKGFFFAVKVTPRASRSEVLGWEGGELCVRLAAVPDKGKANDELIKVLSRALGVAKSQIELVSGAASRHKRLLLTGVAELPALLRCDP